jgi:Right handed beta helix region
MSSSDSLDAANSQNNLDTGMTLLGPILTALLLLWTDAPVSATDYYVSSTGNDDNSGLSSDQAWKTLDRVGTLTLEPGDRVFLEGGQRFIGSLSFDHHDSGTEAAPITVTSYGSGRATIDAGGGHGLYAYNTAGFLISSINFIGTGRTDNTADGLAFYTDLPGDVKLPGIRVEEIDVAGFGRNGIAIGGWNGRTGFRHVRISKTVAHDNGINGVIIYAQEPNTNEDVYVGHTRAYSNSGGPTELPSSGSGILLGGVDGGLIEWSTAHDNGARGNAGVGIWTYASRNIVIKHCRSFRNRTGGPTDGGGFDLDGGVTDSIMEYNYSHDNDGAGYLLAQYPDAPPWSKNIVRYNMSINDGRKNDHAAIQSWNGGSGLADADIHHNIVVVGPSDDGNPSALSLASDSRQFLVHDNVFVAEGDVMLQKIPPDVRDVRLYRNRCVRIPPEDIADHDGVGLMEQDRNGSVCER